MTRNGAGHVGHALAVALRVPVLRFRRLTPPARDVDELRRLIQRFGGAEAQLSGDHPLFGALTATEWGKFSYRHADHHLRQFGV